MVKVFDLAMGEELGEPPGSKSQDLAQGPRLSRAKCPSVADASMSANPSVPARGVREASPPATSSASRCPVAWRRVPAPEAAA
jgi:hypothetical protein